MLRRVTLGLVLTLMGVLFPVLQASGQEDNIWISPQEIFQLPTEGSAWDALWSEANRSTGSPNLSNQDDNTNVRVMAKALLFVKTGTERYRQDVIEACMDAIGTESGGRTLALGRELMAYVIAAGLVGLPEEDDVIFRDWLNDVLDKNLQGKTLRSTHRERPNNWGRVCGASRAAIAVYLGNSNELAECAAIFRGWLGDRNSYNDFKYGSDLSWQYDPNKPVGINPAGAYKNGRSIDGVLPEEMRRSGSFTWPPPLENYVYEALQGAVAMAVILSRNGYPDVWNWEDKALLRAFRWLYYEADFPATGDDGWLPHIINFYYSEANFNAPVPATPGKNAGWADWTHGERDIPDPVYLTLNTTGNGSVSAEPSGGIYNVGETVYLSANPSNGYVFSHWSGSISGNNSSASVLMDDDKTITANFIPEENYSLTVHSNGGGLVTIDPPGGYYSPGSNITLTAESFPGYIFTGWGNDLNSTANPASLVMDEDKIVVANFEEQTAGSGAVVHHETKTGGASGAQVSTASSLQNVQGHVYYVAITMKKLEEVTSVSGLGLNWTRVATQCAARSQTGIEIWSARGNGGANGKVTAQFAVNVSNAAISVSRYSGVSTSSPLVGILQGNSNGLNGQCSNGTDSDRYNFSTYNTIDSLFIFSAIAHRNRRHAPGPGFTERVQMHHGGGGSTAGLSVMDRSISGITTANVNGTFNSSVDWAAIGLLLRPASNNFQPEQYTLTTSENGNGDILLNPEGGVYDEGTTVELYAKARAGSVFDYWEGDLNGTVNPVNLAMNSDKAVTAVFTDLPVYELSVEIVGNGNVSADPANGPYLTGTTVTLTATAQPGYEFAGWSGDLNGTSNQASITMDSDKSVTATFTEIIPEYNLTVSVVGSGTVDVNPDLNAYPAGTTVTLVATAQAGYEFSGWSGDLSGTSNQTSITMNSDKSVTATFTEIIPEYNLTVSVVGSGTVDVDPDLNVYPAGTTVTLTATPQPGYEFSGWSGDLSGTSNQISLTMTSNKSVTATFTEIIPEYNLTVSVVGSGTVDVNPNLNAYPAGTTVTLTATPLPGYEFSGWSGDLSGTSNQTSITMNSNKSVTATFVEVIPPDYNLTVEIAGNGSVSKNPATGPYPAGTIVTLTATPQDGYKFSIWSGDLSGNENPATITMDSDKTVTATFTPIQAPTYTLTTTVNGAGSIILDPAEGPYDEGTVVTLTAMPQAGYEFNGWSGDLNGFDNPATLTMNSNKAVTASFTEIPPVYNLTVEIVGNGSVSVNPENGPYLSGTTVTLTATPQSGYQFSGWSGDLTGNSNPAVLQMDSDKTVNAVFTEIPPTQYELTVQVSGSGDVMLDPAGGMYNAGQEVMMTAMPQNGFEFIGWSGDMTGNTNPEMAYMTSNKSVTATFAPIPPPQYNLTVEVVGGGTVTLDPAGGTYDEGTVVTLTATPDDGYMFLRWAGNLSGTSSPATITMDAHKTVGAVFEAIPVTNITREEIELGSSSNSSSVSTSSSLTAVGEDIYLATISMNKYQIVSRVDGLGLNWELVKEICSGRSNSGVSVWVGRGTASQNGRVTARLQARAESAVIAVVRYSGVYQDYPVGSRIAVNTNGENGSCLDGGASSSFENTINTPVDNCVIFNAVAVRHRTLIPGNGYEKIVELYRGSGGSTTGLAIQEHLAENSGTVSVDATLDNMVDWAHIALVLIPNNPAEGGTLGRIDMNLNNDENLRVLPETIQLQQNYPNPFNGATTIQYALPDQMSVRLKIYDTAGREILTLVNESQEAGIYSYRWDGNAYNGISVSSGFYFVRLTVGAHSYVKKMIYQK